MNLHAKYRYMLFSAVIMTACLSGYYYIKNFGIGFLPVNTYYSQKEPVNKKNFKYGKETKEWIEGYISQYMDDKQYSINSIKKKPISYRNGTDCVLLEINNTIWLYLNVIENQIYQFHSGASIDPAENMRADILSGKKHILTEEQAFKIAEPVLKYYNLKTDRKLYEMKYSSAHSIINGFEVYLWVLMRELEINSIPCRFTGIFMKISPYTGEVLSVRYQPAITPKVIPDKVLHNKKLFKNFKKWIHSVKGSKLFNFDDDDLCDAFEKKTCNRLSLSTCNYWT
jgi:hypothetical protein